MISKLHKKKDGSFLCAFDFQEIPFEVKRAFITSSAENEICKRGFHAHHRCLQILTCITGEIELYFENEKEEGSVTLVPGDSYYHKNLEWLVLSFLKKNSVLMSFCSEEYDELDYIRNYNYFKNLIKGIREGR